MQKIKQLYRSTYEGEHVVTNLVYENSRWTMEKEYVPNAITNIHTTTQALVIGNGPTRKDPSITLQWFHIRDHKGGFGGADKLQTYGCNGLYKEFEPDFLMIDDDMAAELANDGYPTRKIVYAHGNAILDYPGQFYLIPQDPNWNAGAVAAYMACFDGHKKVYLMGIDPGDNVFYERAMLEVFNTYPDVEFVRIALREDADMPLSWQAQLNLRQVDYRGFVVEADIG
jgi:hypothetical protein